MDKFNDKRKIIEHYNLVSPYYHSLWGEHLHHGYWVSGKETKDEAQLALTEHLAKLAEIKPSAKILDVGCGFGASSIYLAKHYNAQTTGITISQVQVEMATDAAKKAGVISKFLLMDADAMNFDDSFDVIWSIESISHYNDKQKFFERSTQLLMPHGVIAIIDWFKKENLAPDTFKKYISPIEKGMLVELQTMDDYTSMLKSNRMEIVKSEDISKNTAKTWDISLEIIKDKKFWSLALQHGKEFISFLKAFRAMKNGFSSENFVYGLIIARKLNNPK